MTTDPRRVLAADATGAANPALVAAAQRAGGTGVLDIADPGALAAALADLARRGVVTCWLRPAPALDAEAAPIAGVDAVVVASTATSAAADRVGPWLAAEHRVIAQVTSRAQGEAALAAGATGLIASGCEGGGAVGDTEAFILFQQLISLPARVALGTPVWVRGGMGLHTAAAVVAGGGAGVLLDGQLGLLRESALGHEARKALEAMDGSETRVVGGHRIYTRPDLPAAALPDDLPAAEVAGRLGPDLRRDLLPFGQDAAFAAGLARRYVTVGGVVRAVQEAVDDHLAAA
ncbi:MAG: 6-deoxyerythronolide-B synthase, partial [Acidimicrobiales bacterium]|nr:6-deoxyerythronolide-B synthase [Acidimicrobiales bacterium]